MKSENASIVWQSHGIAAIEERSKRRPVEGEVSLRVLACGLCGIDSHIVKGEFVGAKSKADTTDVVFECAGSAPAVAYSIKIARRGGRVVLVGVAAPETEVSFRPFEVFRRELTILGTFANPYTTRRTVQLLAADTDRWRPLVTHVYPLAQFAEAWDIHQADRASRSASAPTTN